VLYQLSYKRILLVLRLQRYELFLKPTNFSSTFFKKRGKKTKKGSESYVQSLFIGVN